MKKYIFLNVILALVATIFLAACSGGQSATPAPVDPSFQNDVVPILQSNCARCHGQAITSYDTLAGSGLIVAGDSQGSRIVQVLQAGIMPRGGRKLPDTQIQTIANWIDAGASNN